MDHIGIKSTADANRSESLSRNTRFLEVMLLKGNKIRKNWQDRTGHTLVGPRRKQMSRFQLNLSDNLR